MLQRFQEWLYFEYGIDLTPKRILLFATLILGIVILMMVVSNRPKTSVLPKNYDINQP
jgi:hypothetical protein